MHVLARSSILKMSRKGLEMKKIVSLVLAGLIALFLVVPSSAEPSLEDRYGKVRIAKMGKLLRLEIQRGLPYEQGVCVQEAIDQTNYRKEDKFTKHWLVWGRKDKRGHYIQIRTEGDGNSWVNCYEDGSRHEDDDLS